MGDVFEALIGLSVLKVVQAEAGPPVPGTYRHDFMNDTEPREVLVSRRGNMGHFAALLGPLRRTTSRR